MKMSSEKNTEVTLSAVTEKLNEIKQKSASLKETQSVYFLNNFTLDMIRPFLEYELYQGSLVPEVYFGLFNVIQQNIVDPKSELHRVKPRLVVLSLIFDQFFPDYDKREWSSEEVINSLESLFISVREKTDSIIVLNTFLPPLTHSNEPSELKKIGEINQFIFSFVENNTSRFFLSDWNTYLGQIGRERAIDLRYWYMSKAPFRPAFLSLYAADIGKLSRAVSGKVKKVLVLDCDNTLWGGVVGEDGLQGIKLHPSEYPGVAFYKFQKRVLELKNRGVLLCVCSKNNEPDVLEVFTKHPHCLLKPDDFVLKSINWNNKAENIKIMAEALNLGLDSLVFIDDSDFECQLVTSQLPQVQVIQTPKNAYELPQVFSNDPFFSFFRTHEDQQKAEQYRIKFAQDQSRKEFSNLDEYLASLKIEVSLREMKPSDVARVAQLTQKTNQFNLTTKRYTEAEIQTLGSSSDSRIYVLNVRDRFGDMGLTNVLIFRKTPSGAQVDTCLMSCRVFERNIEYVFFDWAVKKISLLWNIDQISAFYERTLKNVVCSQFWEQVGFSLQTETPDLKTYSLSLRSFKGYSHSHIKLIEE